MHCTRCESLCFYVRASIVTDTGVVVVQSTFSVRTQGRGSYDISAQIQQSVAASQVETGIAHVFLRHTSASLMFCENADPDVQRDLETWMSSAVVDGDPAFVHDAEGPDDMAAHVRTMLSGSDLSVAVGNAKALLGTWQGVYLWEHRTRPHTRDIVVTVQGVRRGQALS